MSTAPAPETKYNFDRVARLVISTLVAVGLFLLLRFLSDVLLPFAAAVLLAYLLNPVVELLDRRIQRRAVSVALTVGIVFVVIAGVTTAVIPLLHREISDIALIISDLRDGTALADEESFNNAYLAFYESSSAPVKAGLDQVTATLNSINLEQMVLSAAKKLAPGVWGVLSGALSMLLGLMGLIIVLLYLVFLLIDYPNYRRQWKDLLPPKHREGIAEFFEEFTAAMSRYFRGQTLIAIIVGVLFATGFSLIGLRMGILLGVFIGLLNMVPYLQTVGLVPALFLAVIRAIENPGSGLVMSAALVLAIFGVVQTLQDTLLTPRIMGKSTGLKPITILLGIFIWGKLLGFLGVLLAIPLTCLGIAYYRRFVLNREFAVPGQDGQNQSLT